MSSFRANKTDLANINKIILDRGGLSKSDAIRVALQETATNEPKLVIKPQLPPIDEVEKVISTLNRFIGELRDANRCGWPEHNPGENAERAKKVDEARQRYEATFAEFEPRVNQLRILRKSVNACERMDVTQLKMDITIMQQVCEGYETMSKNSELPQNTRALMDKRNEALKRISGFFTEVGIIQKNTP